VRCHVSVALVGRAETGGTYVTALYRIKLVQQKGDLLMLDFDGEVGREEIKEESILYYPERDVSAPD
jgi:hypothetical protein